MADDRKRYNRRDFLADTVRWLAVLTAGGALGSLATRAWGRDTVWQIDPNKCTHCDKCATQCVLAPSAVKCIHAYAMCGYCKLCFGFFRDQRPDNGAGAENVRCPTDAIRRSPVEDPYYQYIIDEARCIGCAVCVDGCNRFGNGSLFLQIRHDRCANCNQCAIALACPSGAISRVPAKTPYLLKTRQ